MRSYQGCDFPEFMLNTRKVPLTKNGKFRDYDDVKKDKAKLRSRINDDLYCPMNVLIHDLENIKSMKHIMQIPVKNFFVKVEGKANNKQMGKIASLVEAYAYDMFFCLRDCDDDKLTLASSLTDELIDKIHKIKITNRKTINRLIEIALGLTSRPKQINMLKILYLSDKKKFLENFTSEKKSENGFQKSS